MGVVDAVKSVVSSLSDSVEVKMNDSDAALISCPEIPPILVLHTRGGHVVASSHFPEKPDALIVWEDQWKHKPEVIQSRITARFGNTTRIHARQCDVVELHKPVLDGFLNEHHMHPPMGAKTKLGLTRTGNLVAVASFSKPCPINRDGREWKSVELIRFCNAKGITVVGGFSKMIQYFIRTFSPEDIMTYADLDWSTGDSYRGLGFREMEKSQPQQFWIQPKTMRRFTIRQEAEILHETGLAQMDEKKLLNFGWTLIQNRGSLKFILEVK